MKHLYIFDNRETLANSLIEATRGLERKGQHRHLLKILTCYFEIEAIRKLINELLENVKLTEIEIIVDSTDASKIGIDALEKEFNAMGIDSRIDCSKGLLHAKAYSLRQYTSQDLWVGGVLIVSSGNATQQGMYGINKEIGYLSNLKKDLDEFDEIFESIWEKSVSADEFRKRKRKRTKYYDILASGVFLHKWEGNLNQLFSARYRIKEGASSEMEKDEDLLEWGVKFGKTISIPVFDFSKIKRYKISKEFFRNYTIETYLGRWCPASAWEYINECLKKNNDRSKKRKILDSQLSNLDEARKTLKHRQDLLLKKQYIIPPEKAYTKKWANKVNRIHAESDLLFERLLTGYESFQLPYKENDSEIEELYESLRHSVEIARSKGVVKKWLLKNNNVSYTLTSNDRDMISRCVKTTEENDNN